MMITLIQQKNRFIFFIMLFFFSNCSQINKFPPYNCEIDKGYLELLNESGVDLKSIKKKNIHCNIYNKLNDTLYLKQFYSEQVYFKGIIYKDKKMGLWKGYFNEKLIIEIAYLGEINNRPIFVRLWKINGDFIRYTKFSTIE